MVGSTKNATVDVGVVTRISFMYTNYKRSPMATKKNQKPKTRVSLNIDFEIDTTEGVHLTPISIQEWIETEFLSSKNFSISIHTSENTTDFSF